jgi:hypothetical protein
MTASSSLNASANTLESIGRVELARQCRLWAVAAETMGDALYRDYARQLAEYSTVKAFEHRANAAGAAPRFRASGMEPSCTVSTLPGFNRLSQGEES